MVGFGRTGSQSGLIRVGSSIGTGSNSRFRAGTPNPKPDSEPTQNPDSYRVVPGSLRFVWSEFNTGRIGISGRPDRSQGSEPIRKADAAHNSAHKNPSDPRPPIYNSELLSEFRIWTRIRHTGSESEVRCRFRSKLPTQIIPVCDPVLPN